jgi:NAD+ synthase (glutamine-hydrolysing)
MLDSFFNPHKQNSKLKIATCQLNYHTGNFEQNTTKIIASINEAKRNGCDIVVFSELSVCGYPPRDFLEFTDFIERCNFAVESIASACIDIMAIVGAPFINPQSEGKDLFNAAFILFDGKVQQVVRKTLLPNYDIFDEYRYFEPNKQFEIVNYKGVKIALTICEDLWNVLDNPMYVINPMDELMQYHPDIMINIAASPYSIHQQQTRVNVLSANVSKYNLPLLYVNMTGAQTQLIFDGGSMAIHADGTIVDKLASFEEDFGVYAFDISSKQFTVEKKHLAQPPITDYESIRMALTLGIREYFHKQGFTKAIIGLSGGIDSAVVTALATQALGKENVYVLLMPSRYSSNHSVSDAIDMVNLLGIGHQVLSIESAFQTVEQTLHPLFKDTQPDLAEENIQSRLRGLLLMAVSNKFGYILLNTSNKSELAVGYGTLYGDMCGGLSVIGDLYKTQVYQLANHLNKIAPHIPPAIINKEPSAELRHDQKDSDSLPPYNILDEILYHYIELRNSPRQLIELGFEKTLVNRVLKMVNTNEWKRLQAPPVLRVSSKSFGPGRRMPIVAKYLS